jgi:CheY-like chemotaxis protein
MSNRESQSQSSGVSAVCARGALAALIVEDSSRDVEFIVRAFQKMGYLPVWWRQVADADGMKTALVEETWDVVVSEHRMPAFDSFRALAVLGASGVTVPLIMFTGSIPGELARAAFRAGVAELVIDDGFDELGRAVSRCLPRKDSGVPDAAVQAMHESEEYFQSAIEMLIDPFVLLKPLRDQAGEILDFVYEYANHAAYDPDGRGQDLVGMGVLERLTQLVPVVPFDACVTVVETGAPLAIDDFAQPNGGCASPSERFLDVRALKAGDALVLTWRDVTECERHAAIV